MKRKIRQQVISKCFNIVMMLIMAFVSLGRTYAQETPKLNVTSQLKIKDGDLKNSLITVTKAGAPYKVMDPSKGEDNVDLPLGFIYQLSFTKLGYSTKTIAIDTHVPDNRENGKFAKQNIVIELEKTSENQAGGNSQSAGKIEYSTIINDFDFSKIAGKTDKTQQVYAPLPPAILNKIPPAKQPPVKQPEPDTPNKNTIGRNKEVKVIQEDTRKVTIIKINSNGKDYIYKKEEYSWGGIYYYKDGINITESVFEQETE